MIATATDSARSRKLTLIQALRGVAALWVVLFHAAEGGHIPTLRDAIPNYADTVLFSWGHYGVSIFFALSGFVIAYSLRDAALTPRFLGRFILRRALRLDPPYWASIIAAVAISALSAHVGHKDFTPPSASHIGAHLVYLQEILQIPEINTAFWTLTYEIQFYLFLVSALVLAQTMRTYFSFIHAADSAWLFLYGVSFLAAIGSFDGMLPGLFLPLWKDFFIGVLAYRAVETPWARIGLIVLTVPMMAHGPLTGTALFSRISALTALGLFVATYTGWAYRGLNQRGLQFLGAVSYSLYLLHNPITGATAYVTHRLFGVGVAADLATLTSSILTSIAAAVIFWLLIEQTSHHLSRRIKLPKTRNVRVSG